MARDRKYDDEFSPSARQYRDDDYYEDDDYYSDYDEYDDYDDDEYYDEDEYYDDNVAEDDYDDDYDDDEYYFEDDEDYYDRPGIFARIAARASRPAMVFIISLVIVIVMISAGWRVIDNRYFQPVDKDSQEVVDVEIIRKNSVSEIADTLVEEGIIRDKTVFKLYTDLNDKGSKMRAGVYKLSPAMTINEIVDILCSGEYTDTTNQFQLIEGKNADDLLAELKKKKLMRDEAQFIDIITNGTDMEDYQFVAALLPDTSPEPTESPSTTEGDGQEDNSTEEDDSYLDPGYSLEIVRIEGKRQYILEGYLFPDTYNVYSDSKPKEIIIKMLNRFNNIYSDGFYERAEKLGMTTDDVVTLASIIEKEAREEDFAKVSAVFHNRLRRKNPEERILQSCATAQYFLGTTKLYYDPEEVTADNPYNTYKYPGLPVGPICNPSQKAIEAALFPDEEYLAEGYQYFCVMDPDPGEDKKVEMKFSKTYNEHKEAVNQYRPLWNEYENKRGNE